MKDSDDTTPVVKLTKHQEAVVGALQDGAILITDREIYGAHLAIGKGKDEEVYQLSSKLFYNLREKGMVFQMFRHPWDFVLTEEGEAYPIKKYDLSVLKRI